jgi:hypothetical protein
VNSLPLQRRAQMVMRYETLLRLFVGLEYGGIN